MSLASNALTTVATVQARARVATGTDDDFIEQLVNEVSGEIERVIGRPVIYGANIVELIGPRGGPKILVERRPIVSLTSVELLSGESWVTLGADHYEIHSADAGVIYRRFGFPWSAMRAEGVNFNDDQEPGTERHTCRVTYSAGWLTAPQVADGGPFEGQDRTLPYDLERACVLGCVSAYRGDARNRNVRSETVGRASRSFADSNLPPEVLELVQRYASWGVG